MKIPVPAPAAAAPIPAPAPVASAPAAPARDAAPEPEPARASAAEAAVPPAEPVQPPPPVWNLTTDTKLADKARRLEELLNTSESVFAVAGKGMYLPLGSVPLISLGLRSVSLCPCLTPPLPTARACPQMKRGKTSAARPRTS